MLTQTTLSVSDTAHLILKLSKKFPKLITGKKEDICYATQNRQDAVKELTKECDIVIICGSPNSSNSNRLRETAEQEGVESYIVDFAHEFDLSLLDTKSVLGISSGASVPYHIVEDLVKRIQAVYPNVIITKDESIEKGIEFPLPKEIADFRQ